MALSNGKASLCEVEGVSMISIENLRYVPFLPYRWKIPSQVIPIVDLDKICETCDSIKDKDIEKLKAENRKLRKQIAFLQNEVHALELKTALTAKAVPLKDMVAEVTSTPEGKKAWDEAWEEQFAKWRGQMETGAISRVKYYRLINGMNQKTLAEKLRTAQPNISRIERPDYNVPLSTLKKIAKLFNVKVENLIGS
jgi:DNA-binding XRE family transcriptional regulator